MYWSPDPRSLILDVSGRYHWLSLVGHNQSISVSLVSLLIRPYIEGIKYLLQFPGRHVIGHTALGSLRRLPRGC